MAKARDDNFSFGQGQNSSVRPYILPDGYFFRGINLTTVNDKLSIRPKFIHQEVEVIDDGLLDKTTYAENFKHGKYQGDCPYTSEGIDYLIVIISGIVYQVDLERKQAYVLNADDRLSQYTNRINCANLGKYVEIYDYPDRPLVISGTDVFRTDTIEYGTPSAVAGLFNYNRSFIVNATNEWLASDPVGGESPDAPLSYVESTNPQSPFFGAFNLGFKNRNSKITHIGSLTTNDTGIGALILSTDQNIYSYAVNQPREGWASGVFGGELVGDVGIAGFRSAVSYKRDLIFLSSEGFLTTVRFARSQEQGNLVVNTLSGGSQELLDSLFPELYEYAVLETAKERLYTTAKPFRTLAKDTYGNSVEDIAHAGIHVMEFQTKQGREERSPVEAGLWTGIYPTSIRRIGSSLYVFSKDPFNNNRIYKVEEDADMDVLKGKQQQVSYRLYTKGYSFGALDRMKDLNSHTYELSYSGNWEQQYHILKNENDAPIKLACETKESSLSCNTLGSPNGKLLPVYLDNYSLGVEVEKNSGCNKFFRSIQLVLTGTARVFNLFRISLGANITPDDNMITSSEVKNINNQGCNFKSDLNVYTLAPREDNIK